MRTRLILVAAFVAVAVWANPAAALDPYAQYNRARAYQQFLSSPYRVRTYSGNTGASAATFSNALEYGTIYQGPGYVNERISPRGFESTYIPGPTGVRVVRRPVLVPLYLPPWP